jgi:hypothetical protein
MGLSYGRNYDGYDNGGKTELGHNVQGGGATVKDSPIIVNPVIINVTMNIGKDFSLEHSDGRPTDGAKAIGFLASIFRGVANRGLEHEPSNSGPVTAIGSGPITISGGDRAALIAALQKFDGGQP